MIGGGGAESAIGGGGELNIGGPRATPKVYKLTPMLPTRCVGCMFLPEEAEYGLAHAIKHVSSLINQPKNMGGELSKREGVLLRSFEGEARSFCCVFHWFIQIYALITISLLDIGFKRCFTIYFFCFERVLLAMRGCTLSLRGCSRTLKTPNSPPLTKKALYR